jgi:hypothetical protein
MEAYAVEKEAKARTHAEACDIVDELTSICLLLTEFCKNETF